ncbi:hypothetical protein HKBW3S03_00563 [Candidatus Hakubella thermalkaliphila]|uniref:Uncharacterized protein n=1 Tax=Candidatus Hakubella thermalkaliphila TaxID=2754717 RepID=A0A6V8PBH2_9ACTN|nr:hypothetical protein [Candidatus Hakubella thermalkaliphila]GFP19059.1 hypothetical protein HKBW3S03_00563 [Candidatus Hakubella thermalkaliphila]GFP29648.1 hypothetical protein HKBW3S34_00568 [Candidatus Hakubella thermalkaliphila]
MEIFQQEIPLERSQAFRIKQFDLLKIKYLNLPFARKELSESAYSLGECLSREQFQKLVESFLAYLLKEHIPIKAEAAKIVLGINERIEIEIIKNRLFYHRHLEYFIVVLYQLVAEKKLWLDCPIGEFSDWSLKLICSPSGNGSDAVYALRNQMLIRKSYFQRNV